MVFNWYSIEAWVRFVKLNFHKKKTNLSKLKKNNVNK